MTTPVTKTTLHVDRTHDLEIYLHEDRYERSKEYHKHLAQLAIESRALRQGCSVGDFGCATGEFLYHLSRRFPDACYTGYDVAAELLAMGRERVPWVTFVQGNVLDRNLALHEAHDVTFMMGVHPVFDEFETCFSNMLYWTRPGGTVYIIGPFNPYPVEVWVLYRKVDDPDPMHREQGWNLFSLASVSRWLDAIVGADRYKFTLWEIGFDLSPHPHDIIRTWTIRDENNHRQFTNGVGVLRDLYILEIRKP